MNRAAPLALVLSLFLAAPAFALGGATLKGSSTSMVRQNSVAKANDYSFLRSAAQVDRFVEEGYLVPIESTGSLEVNSGVSYPVARPQMKIFLERLGNQYHESCGEPLVVTSLVRPTSEQPRNSHPLSVHPAGMAADLRISARQDCRAWLESTLLDLEARELLDVTRERKPPHYHVALFPDRYLAYIQPLLARDSALAAERAREQAGRLAMASLEHAATPLLATAAPAAEPQRAALGLESYALLLGLVVALGVTGARRLLPGLRSAERK
ncbi:MAG TPA: DUF5715 family protein [Longimicrobiaceae bacterium]